MKEYLRSIVNDMVHVKGEFDQDMNLPQAKTVQAEGIRVGVIHGHQIIPWGDTESLDMTARQLDVDILISGHTHQFEAFEYNDKFFINPGSATGAYSSMDIEPVPSFVLMDIQKTSAVTYVYKLIDDQVKVEKLEYSKRSNLY